jgi:hypothetical protein
MSETTPMPENPGSNQPETATAPITPPARTATVPPPPRPGRNQLILALAFAAAMGILLLLLPTIYRAHTEYLLWSEGFMEQAFARSFLSGHFEKLIETPKPLWNMFWLLSPFPNRLFLLIVIMIAVVFFLFPYLSRKLTGSVVFGVVASLVTFFGFRDALGLMLEGSWILPVILLGLIFLLAVLSKRWGWATVAVGLSGLIRPESWLLAIFLIVLIAVNRERLKWYHFVPLLAPLFWAWYDYRISGDWLYSYRNTAAYAVLTGVPSVDFISFWPRLIPDIIESTGIIALLYAVAGIIIRARNIAHEAKERKTLAVLFDPLFAVTLLPLIAAWIMSIQGNLIIMRRFFFLSIGLMAFYAVLLPYEISRARKVANRNFLIGAIWLPLILVALVRLPGISRDVHRGMKVTEAKMAAIVGLCEEITKPVADLSEYRSIFIPFRRYAQFTTFLSDSIARKFISYREVSLAVTSTQLALLDEVPEPPPGSPQFLKDLVLSRKQFADYLPALALWVPDDEVHYIDAFSFDDPDYFHKNYIDHGRYAFRIIGSALDSLGLIYDVREIEPGSVQDLLAPASEPAPELPYRVEDQPPER